MAGNTDTTRILIDLDSRIRNLERTLRGLDQIKKRLDAIGGTRTSTQGVDRAAVAAQKLALQQQKLVVQTQELANRQERARQATERLSLSQHRLEQSQQRVESGVRRTGQSVLNLDQILERVGGSLRNLGLGLTSLGSSLTVALTAPLTAIGVIATRNAVTLDSLKRGLTAITGSADEAGRQLTRLTEIAKLPGIGFQEAIQGSIRLQAVGFSAEKAEKALIQFSNAVALTGGGREELARITVQLGQLSAKGKVLAQDLKPIIEAGPAVGRALLQAFGTVNSEDIQALGLSSEEFLDRLVKQLEQLPRAAAGLRNTFDNFSDAIFRSSAAIGEAILPVLTRLITIAEPIIIRLSNAFKQLPPSVQTLVVAFGALAAAAGPALFIFGQLATGVGGVISAFARLSALGLVPTIEGFRLMIPVLRGTTVALTAQQAAAAAAATTWTILAAAVTAGVAVLAVAAIALIAYSEAQEKALEVDTVAARERLKRIPKLEAEVEELEKLAKQTSISADEQERLRKSYELLEGAARGRVALVETETEKLRALIEAKREQLRLDQFAAQSTSAQVVKNVTLALEEQRKAEAELADARTRFKNATLDAASASNVFGARTLTATDILIRQEAASLKAAKALDDIGKARASVAAAAQVIVDLSEASGRSTETLLQQAKAAGVDEKQIQAVRDAIDRLAQEQRASVDDIDSATDAIERQVKMFRELSNEADKEQKSRRDRLKGVIDFLRENTDSIEDARRGLENYIQLFPELGEAIEKERRAGRIEQFLNELTGIKAPRKGDDSAVRNAREQLANALLEIIEAEAEKQFAIQKASNEQLLRANETSYALQLRSYREYLETRALFTESNLDLEIKATLIAEKNARLAAARLLKAAQTPGIPQAERLKRQAQARKEEEKAIQAETRRIELESERADITAQLHRDLATAAIQQQKDVRQLDIEFAELRGRIEDALNAQTVERFREQLEQLGKSQKFLNEQLTKAKQRGDKDRQVEIEKAQQLNQSQIDAIELIVQQERALNKLAEVNEFVRRAKEEQTQLERDLAFEVEFRGLKEEDAIKKRLEGERRLADSLAFERDLVQATIDRLEAAKFPVPQALLEFVRNINAEIRVLGELPFAEQFRLVEKEFNRLNEERLQKTQEIERAVRERDIAEAEGLLIIRRINGQYSADLERQVELLKQIATASNDASLQRQAQQAEQTAKDANSQLADFNRQLRSTSIDALQDGFTDFFASIGDRSRTAKEKLLDLVDSVVARINQVIAENLSKKLIESLFGGGDADAGIIASIGRLFGLGGKGAEGGAGGAIAGGISQTAEVTAAATALTTGATAAATALTTGGATAGATLVTSITAGATAFASSVIAAGAAFAAAVAAAGAAAGVSQGLGGLGAGLGAATGIFPAIPGGAIRIVEGGYPEAVLTTDPRHAARQVGILRELIRRTRGFYGRVELPEFATGGFPLSRASAESNMLSAINRAPSFSPRIPDAALQATGGAGDVNVRIVNQVESRALARPYLTSQEGVRDILNIVSTNSNHINRRINR